MSKVKYNPTDIRKSKLRRSLRRKETAKKKQERLFNYKYNVYPSMAGYYTKDYKWVGEYKEKIIPEKIVDEKVLDGNELALYIDSSGNAHYYTRPVYKIIKRTIPEHKVRCKVNSKKVSIPERPVRIKTNLKAYRKMAERKVRNTPVYETYNNSDYKKLSEVKWLLW